MLKIRRSRDRLIFNMGIPIPGKGGLYIETGPRLKAFVSVDVFSFLCMFTVRSFLGICNFSIKHTLFVRETEWAQDCDKQLTFQSHNVFFYFHIWIFLYEHWTNVGVFMCFKLKWCNQAGAYFNIKMSYERRNSHYKSSFSGMGFSL